MGDRGLFDDLQDDLKRLRRNDGCTPERLQELMTLRDILGGDQLPFRPCGVQRPIWRAVCRGCMGVVKIIATPITIDE